MASWKIIALAFVVLLVLFGLGGIIVACETLEVNRKEIDKSFRDKLKK